MITDDSDSQKRTDDRNGDGREARVARDAADDPIGAAVFLTADELAALGIDPGTTNTVEVTVENGGVNLSPSRSTGE